jgi:hypothetical protein
VERIYLVCFVQLVGLVQLSKRDKPNNGLLVLADFSCTLLAADNEKIARSNGRAGETILRLERLDRDVEPFRHFSKRVSHADLVPARGPGGDKLSPCRKLWKLVGRDVVKELFDPRFRSHRNLQVVGLRAEVLHRECRWHWRPHENGRVV